LNILSSVSYVCPYCKGKLEYIHVNEDLESFYVCPCNTSTTEPVTWKCSQNKVWEYWNESLETRDRWIKDKPIEVLNFVLS
jgi:uncharacterized protein YbaR (Trm112 family)